MMLQYANTDHAALSWDQALQLVSNGKAAMILLDDRGGTGFFSLAL